MSRKKIVIFLAIAIFYTHGLSQVNGQGKRDDLKEKRITIQLKNISIYDVFVRLMYVYDVPIGFEESVLDKDHDDYFFQTIMPPNDKKGDYPNEPQKRSSDTRIKGNLISLDMKEARLEDVLDEIVKRMQNYDWTINDNVVNIFPIKGRDPRFEKLLDLNIRGFGLSKGQAFESIQPMIVFDLPEFKIFLAENKLHAESERYLPSYSKLPISGELRFADLTFRELLNDITRLKRGGWILRNGDKRKKPENKGKDIIELLL